VIDAAGGCLDICGERITNTCLNDADSAVEAMCVAVEGVSERQLARQLTAAALNCVVSGGGATCSGISIEDLFADCNLVCSSSGTSGTRTVQECIDRLDDFNNGLVTDCHDRTLCNTEVPGLEPICNDQPPNPAGSSDECDGAGKNTCTVIEKSTTKSPKNEGKCKSGSVFHDESCEAGNCLAGTNASALCLLDSECPGSTCGNLP
jgi:hypothetical protein